MEFTNKAIVDIVDKNIVDIVGVVLLILLK